MPEWFSAWAVPAGAGVCLAAACGFRTFIPLLTVALASRAGVYSLDAHYSWLATTAGLVTLTTAAVAEVAAYYIPVVDHALDVIATPLATLAGVLAMFTSIGSDHGMLGWLVALVLGGGMASAVQLTTVKARLLSLGTTAGIGNPLVATAELIGAGVLSVIAMLLPLLATVIAVTLVAALVIIVRALRRRAARAY